MTDSESFNPYNHFLIYSVYIIIYEELIGMGSHFQVIMNNVNKPWLSI